MKLTIYTDGGFSYNHNIGSYGFIIYANDNTEQTIERYGLVEHHKQTSQVAEITAILNALNFVTIDLKASKSDVVIYSDSRYCVDTITSWMENWYSQNWQVDKQNLDLWKQIHILKHSLKTLKMVWVKGHAGDHFNERVDKLTNIPLEPYRK